MHPNEQLITNFYTAFQSLDGATMAGCYAPDARFSDPAFPNLTGDEPGLMWRMLCDQATNFELTFNRVQADETRGSAYWEASYDFSVTGRRVHNKIRSEFEFQDGLIANQVDTFDFWAWSRMALGAPGMLLGWTPFLKKKVQGQAAKNLSKYIDKHG